MSLSKQDMKYLANGKAITEEALIAIAAAKRDDFEKWCGTRQFQHFLMRARLGTSSDPMTLPRLQKWAADEMFHLRVSPSILSAGISSQPQFSNANNTSSPSSGPQCAHADIRVQSLEESQTHTGGNLGQDMTSKVPTNNKSRADVEEGPHFIGDDLIAFA